MQVLLEQSFSVFRQHLVLPSLSQKHPEPASAQHPAPIGQQVPFIGQQEFSLPQKPRSFGQESARRSGTSFGIVKGAGVPSCCSPRPEEAGSLLLNGDVSFDLLGNRRGGVIVTLGGHLDGEHGDGAWVLDGYGWRGLC